MSGSPPLAAAFVSVGHGGAACEAAWLHARRLFVRWPARSVRNKASAHAGRAPPHSRSMCPLLTLLLRLPDANSARMQFIVEQAERGGGARLATSPLFACRESSYSLRTIANLRGRELHADALLWWNATREQWTGRRSTSSASSSFQVGDLRRISTVMAGILDGTVAPVRSTGGDGTHAKLLSFPRDLHGVCVTPFLHPDRITGSQPCSTS